MLIKKIPQGYEIKVIDGFIGEKKSYISIGVGDVTLNHTAVPVGKIWVITNVIIYTSIGAPIFTIIFASIGGMLINLRRVATPGVNGEVIFNGIVVLNAGDFIQSVFYGLLINNESHSHIVGFQKPKDT